MKEGFIMEYFLTDIRKIYSNNFIRIMILFLFILAVVDPVLAYNEPINILENPYEFWLLLNSGGIGFKIYRRLIYIFPIISTGLIYFEERNTSLCGILLTKVSRRKYFCSKVFAVFLTTFINFLIPLLLNILITYMLFDANALTTDSFKSFIPQHGMFCEYLFLKNPIYSCILYCVLNAFSEALLAVLVLLIHMVYKFNNRFIAFFVSFIALCLSTDIVSKVFGPKYDFPLIIQPMVAASCNINITTFNVITTYIMFIFILGIIGLICIRRNKDIL